MTAWRGLNQGQRARKPVRRTVCLWGQPDPHTRALLAQCVAEDRSIALIEQPENPLSDVVPQALATVLEAEPWDD